MHERSLEIARITPTAFQALQEAAESYLVVLFEDAYKITMSRKQVSSFLLQIQQLANNSISYFRSLYKAKT